MPPSQPDVLAVWPCEHGNTLVEPGPALRNYRCHECGETATTYVRVPGEMTDAMVSKVAGWVGTTEAVDERQRTALEAIRARSSEVPIGFPCYSLAAEITLIVAEALGEVTPDGR